MSLEDHSQTSRDAKKLFRKKNSQAKSQNDDSPPPEAANQESGMDETNVVLFGVGKPVCPSRFMHPFSTFPAVENLTHYKDFRWNQQL